MGVCQNIPKFKPSMKTNAQINDKHKNLQNTNISKKQKKQIRLPKLIILRYIPLIN